MKLWMCEDAGDPTQSGFGRTKKAAEGYVADNRGYGSFADCVADEWAKPAVQINVPRPVGLSLLAMLEVL